jgi:hypothetical protein
MMSGVSGGGAGGEQDSAGEGGEHARGRSLPANIPPIISLFLDMTRHCVGDEPRRGHRRTWALIGAADG